MEFQPQRVSPRRRPKRPLMLRRTSVPHASCCDPVSGFPNSVPKAATNSSLRLRSSPAAVERADSTLVCREVSKWSKGGHFQDILDIIIPYPDFSLPSFLSNSPQQAKEYAEKMIGSKLITKQTGAAGRICNAVRLISNFKVLLAP